MQNEVGRRVFDPSQVREEMADRFIFLYLVKVPVGPGKPYEPLESNLCQICVRLVENLAVKHRPFVVRHCSDSMYDRSDADC